MGIKIHELVTTQDIYGDMKTYKTISKINIKIYRNCRI